MLTTENVSPVCLYFRGLYKLYSPKIYWNYVTKKGYIKKIHEFENDVVFDDDTEVLIDDILYIESHLFVEIEY